MEILKSKFFSPKLDYGAKCLQPRCDGVKAKYQQHKVSLHNDLSRRVAQGNETLGAPGPQPYAGNVREFVSKILLALYQLDDN